MFEINKYYAHMTVSLRICCRDSNDTGGLIKSIVDFVRVFLYSPGRGSGDGRPCYLLLELGRMSDETLTFIHYAMHEQNHSRP